MVSALIKAQVFYVNVLLVCIGWYFIFMIYYVQLNQYETAPYFLQLSQNLKLDCLLI